MKPNLSAVAGTNLSHRISTVMTANALVVAILGFGLPSNPLLDACPLFGRGSSSSSSATSSNKPSPSGVADQGAAQDEAGGQQQQLVSLGDQFLSGPPTRLLRPEIA